MRMLMDLTGVIQAFVESPTTLETHPFDGAALAQVAGIVSSGGIPVLITWITSRTDKRKHMSINAFGIEASGYTHERARASPGDAGVRPAD